MKKLAITAFLFSLIFLPNYVSAGDILFETIMPWYYSWSSMNWGSGGITYVSTTAIGYKPSTNQAVCTIKAGLYKSGNPTDSVVMTLMGGGNGYPAGGSIIGTATIPGSQVANPPILAQQSAYTAFTFSPCLNLVAGTNYSFVLSRTQPDSLGVYVSQISNFIYYPETSFWAYVPVNGFWQEKVGYEPALRLEGPDTKEPVIIVPGIMGSYLNKISDNEEIWPNVGKMINPITLQDNYLNDLKLDASGSEVLGMYPRDIIESVLSFPQYGDLINKFKNNGYTLNQNLFVFPYDWRLDIPTPLSKLESIIGRATAQSPNGKVNIIAHSMGGLIVKNYLSSHTSSAVNRVVFMGTPNLGAAKAFNALNYGDDFDLKFLGLGLNPNKSKEITQNMPAVYELLPSREYINLAGSYVRDFRNGNKPLNYDETNQLMTSNLADARNPFLLNLADSFHQSLDSRQISGPQVYNIIGCQNPETIGSFRLYPNNKFKIDPTNGDGTVPFISASYKSQSTNNFYVHSVIADHMGLVQNGDVLNLVDGIIKSNPPALPGFISANQGDCVNNTFNIINRKLLFGTHSPVNLHLYDPQNRHTGLKLNGDIELSIPGSNFFRIGDNSFIWTPQGNTYRVEINAYATGSFDFDVNQYQGVNLEASINYLNIPIQSPQLKAGLTVTDINSNPPLIVDKDGNGTPNAIITSQVLSGSPAQDILPPDINIISPASRSYERSQTIPLDVRVSDGQSGVALKEIKIDGKIVTSDFLDLFFYSLGSHSLDVLAYDKAGNSSVKSSKFQVIATVESTISDINRAYEIGWISTARQRDSLVDKLDKVIKIEKKIESIIERLPDGSRRERKIERLKKRIDRVLAIAFLKDMEKGYNRGVINKQAFDLIKEDVEWLLNR